MTNVFIVMLLLYNMWLVFYLLHERKQDKQKDKTDVPSKPTEPESATNIVGRSLFKMSKGRTTGDTAVPQATVPVEGESVEKDDVTFADEMPSSDSVRQGNIGGQPSMRLPDDKLDDAFSDMRLSDVPVEYADGDSEDTGEYASGATIEDMDEAIRTADNPEATDSEKQKAGEVFHEMEGNELYEILMTGNPGISTKIRGLIDLYKSKPTISSGGNKEVESVSPQNIPVMESLKDFDIRDFV